MAISSGQRAGKAAARRRRATCAADSQTTGGAGSTLSESASPKASHAQRQPGACLRVLRPIGDKRFCARAATYPRRSISRPKRGKRATALSTSITVYASPIALQRQASSSRGDDTCKHTLRPCGGPRRAFQGTRRARAGAMPLGLRLDVSATAGACASGPSGGLGKGDASRADCAPLAAVHTAAGGLLPILGRLVRSIESIPRLVGDAIGPGPKHCPISTPIANPFPTKRSSRLRSFTAPAGSFGEG